MGNRDQPDQAGEHQAEATDELPAEREIGKAGHAGGANGKKCAGPIGRLAGKLGRSRRGRVHGPNDLHETEQSARTGYDGRTGFLR